MKSETHTKQRKLATTRLVCHRFAAQFHLERQLMPIDGKIVCDYRLVID